MVDRYKVVVGNVTATAHGAAHPEGEYVLWRDYEALRARVAELEGDLNVTRLQLGARVCSECPARARVAELEAAAKRAEDALQSIGDEAHDLSTGPTVPDGYWRLREQAYREAEAIGCAGNKSEVPK